MIRIDMHVHTTYSDGTYTPDAIACTAKSRGLAFVSITDHDTTAGLLDFSIACKRHGIESLEGIELSAEAPFTLHILGFRIKPGDTALENRLGYIRKCRDERNVEICRKLRTLGIDIVLADVEALATGPVVARPHIARALIKKGYAKTISEAFAKYLGVGGSAYIPRTRITAEECISLIQGAGGVAVMAHPMQTKLHGEEFDALIRRLKNAGLWGMETLYSKNTVYQNLEYTLAAKRFDLFPTAGSDFHGHPGSSIELGIDVDENFLPWARLGLNL